MRRVIGYRFPRSSAGVLFLVAPVVAVWVDVVAAEDAVVVFADDRVAEITELAYVLLNEYHQGKERPELPGKNRWLEVVNLVVAQCETGNNRACRDQRIGNPLLSALTDALAALPDAGTGHPTNFDVCFAPRGPVTD
jgi:hypothetical protein